MENTKAMELGRRLRAARVLAGLEQRELARRAGVSPTTISKAERGERSPHGATLRCLAAALGCDVEALTTGRHLRLVRETEGG